MSAYVIELQQKVTLVRNTWAVLYTGADGQQSQVAQVAQKRFSLKEAVRIDSPAGDPLAFIQGRKVLEIAGTYDVVDASGAVLASIAKDFKRSLGRSTYRVSVPGAELVVQERSQARAIGRRAWGLVQMVVEIPWFLPVQFDVVRADATGVAAPVATIDRLMKLRDHYRVEVMEPALDWRVATAMAVAADAFMNR
jgi:uncharacterized protein YxjI